VLIERAWLLAAYGRLTHRELYAVKPNTVGVLQVDSEGRSAHGLSARMARHSARMPHKRRAGILACSGMALSSWARLNGKRYVGSPLTAFSATMHSTVIVAWKRFCGSKA
jgi:hypothetical protein